MWWDYPGSSISLPSAMILQTQTKKNKKLPPDTDERYLEVHIDECGEVRLPVASLYRCESFWVWVKSQFFLASGFVTERAGGLLLIDLK